VQLKNIANTLITAEALEMAIKLGIDLKWLAGVMETSSGRNVATKDIEGFRSIYRYNARTAESLKALIDICRKDLVLGQALGKQLQVLTPTLYALALVRLAAPKVHKLVKYHAATKFPSMKSSRADSSRCHATASGLRRVSSSGRRGSSTPRPGASTRP
jgi:hypothetical protein